MSGCSVRVDAPFGWIQLLNESSVQMDKVRWGKSCSFVMGIVSLATAPLLTWRLKFGLDCRGDNH
ncbi:hypothetical protein RESH_02159 [Rhodopirellula europaea SH398]|uniref:Uncharacterized protein n=1 Tax=Rhodopirellula europaea SH398 TaxID=1263868 RepID=M5SM62_9BACT|nr:hypothetical protein RESH_02159 [Rhodopirellula europaea SH398]